LEQNADNHYMYQINSVAVIAYSTLNRENILIFNTEILYPHENCYRLNNSIYRQITIHSQVGLVRVLAENISENPRNDYCK